MSTRPNEAALGDLLKGAAEEVAPFEIRSRLLELGVVSEKLEALHPDHQAGVELWVDFAYDAAEREDWLAAKRSCIKAKETLAKYDPKRLKRDALERKQRAKYREKLAPVTTHSDGVRRPQKASRHRDPLSIQWD